MSRPLSRSRLTAAFGCLIVCGLTLVSAQEKPVEPKAVKKPEGKPATGAVVKLLTQPMTEKPEVLAAWLDKVRAFTPKTNEEAERYSELAPAAIKSAAEKILKLEKDPQSAAARTANFNLLALRTEELYEEMDAAKRDATLEETIKFLEDSPKVTGEVAGLATLVADVLENALPPAEAVKWLPRVADVLGKSKDEEILAQAKTLHGLARRLQLPGNVMNLKGKTYDGKPFDVANLKGKVVLVDYWATWCGFCVAEFPNMKTLYKKYHEKGFEIVGVNLDEEKDKLDEFLKKNKLPWPILYDEENGGQHPSAEEYGVEGLPTVILIGADGKVVSLDARGEQLEEHLKSLLDTPEPPPAADAPPKAEKQPSVEPQKPAEEPRAPAEPKRPAVDPKK